MSDIDDVIARVRELDAAGAPGWGNRDLIAAYRTAAPLLAAEVEKLRGEVQSLTLDAVRTESLCHGYTSDLAEAQGEVERLRAELAASEARQAWTASHDEWRAELERLAENAELREALWALDEYWHLACVVDPECGCCTKCDARAALAKGGDK